MSAAITVCIPTIAPRAHLLERAVNSVARQVLLPERVIVEQDDERRGAALTRQRALERVDTEWTAFLDDDDEMLPEHLHVLYAAAVESSADYVFSWYTVNGGTDPRPSEFGMTWDPEHPRQTTITVLVRTSIAQSVGFSPAEDTALEGGEDWRFTLGCVAAGAQVVHVPKRTWIWHHHASNTSGMPNRW